MARRPTESPNSRSGARRDGERPMAQERAERRPGSDSVGPRERDEDREPEDFPDLDVRVGQERLEPHVRAEGGGGEGPAVRRIPEHLREVPDLVEEQVRRDAESYEAPRPQRGDEAQGEDRKQEEERVRPQARLEAEHVSEGLVDQIREDRAEEDEPVVDARRGPPRQQPREAESDPQVAEEERRAHLSRTERT